MQLPQIMEVKGIRTLTSKQLAESYGTTTDLIKKNFSNNRERFLEGKHYITLSGDELKIFKNEVNNIHLVGNRASHLYLWTEKGALLHAKSLNTDKAWEVYDYLVDFYFRAKKHVQVEMQTPIKQESGRKVVDIPENVEIQRRIAEVKRYLTAFDVMLDEYNQYSYESNCSSTKRVMENLWLSLGKKLNALEDAEYRLIEKDVNIFQN